MPSGPLLVKGLASDAFSVVCTCLFRQASAGSRRSTRWFGRRAAAGADADPALALYTAPWPCELMTVGASTQGEVFAR